MKNLLLVALLALTFMSCKKEEVVVIPEDNSIEATVLGRWISVGFEDNIRYDFTANKRHTIYGSGGVFPTLEEHMQENPGLTGHDWVYEGDVVVVDLNFGNYSRLTPEFKCDNYVINWKQEDGTDHSTYYREGHDITVCE